MEGRQWGAGKRTATGGLIERNGWAPAGYRRDVMAPPAPPPLLTPPGHAGGTATSYRPISRRPSTERRYCRSVGHWGLDMRWSSPYHSTHVAIFIIILKKKKEIALITTIEKHICMTWMPWTKLLTDIWRLLNAQYSTPIKNLQKLHYHQPLEIEENYFFVQKERGSGWNIQ